MADFSSQSTDLQGTTAGAQPVQAVQPQESEGGVATAISSLGTLISKGVAEFSANEQTKQQAAILGQITQKQAAINQGVVDGTYDPNQAHILSSSLYSSSLAAYPQLADKITGIGAAFRANTVSGDTEDAVKAKRDQAQKIIDGENQLAISQGYHLDPGMSPAQRGVVIQAAQTNVQARNALADNQKTFAFQQEQGTANRAEQDRQTAATVQSLVTNMAGKNLDAFDAVIGSLQADVKSGVKTPEQAKAILDGQFNMIQGGLKVIGGQKNQEQVTPYTSLFQQKYDLGVKLLDPAKITDDLTNQYKATVTRAKILAVSDNDVKTAVATSEMFGNNAAPLLATNASAIYKSITKLSTTPVTNGTQTQFTPQVAGNPEVEASAVTALKTGIDQLKGKGYSDNMKATAEGSNTINNLLVQTGHLLDQNADPSRLKGMAEFFGSSQYLYMVQHGQIDPTAAQTAKKTFQALYEPAVVQAVGGKLVGTLPGSQTALADAVDVNFSGAGASFTVKKGLSTQDTQAATAAVQGLKTSEQGLNTMVHLGSHLEGNADYQKYWEDNKSILLPQVYPAKAGQVVNGYKYTGAGNYKDPKNWEKVNGGSN